MRNPVLPVSDPPSSLTGERMIQLCFNKAALSLSSYDFPCVNVITLFQPIFSVGVLVFGAFFAGARDLSFAFYGYAVVFLANITTAVYLATIARTGTSCYSPSYRFESSLGKCIFLNTTLNSALTQTVCGNMKDLFTVGLGWMLFGGLPFDLVEEKQKTNFLVLDFAMEVPRRSLAASLSPLRLIDGLPRRRSFNYNQMPEEPIKLAVLKLDGSSFGIQVSKTATVGELKMAVEAAFSHLPITGVGKVSWPHVWAQFCLSYGDHRLINEADYLIEFGIKDGDQLRFIRHISNYCTMMVNHKSKTPHVSSLKQQLKLFSLKPETWKKKGTQGQEDGVDSVTKTQPSFLSTVLGGWLSYKSTPSQRETKHRNVTASTSSHLRAFNNLIARFRFKCYSEKDVWNRKKLISETMK
ncbi:hypothetical protein F2Q70_00034105 [Brassica cretica]|uniref:SNRNP25 ubiquitin-like domain-containing protein n=1 Tax=Brassica cretica TaxID=69181 RepID=A0A8S9JPE9_BRACR|nr:hypothetical protein F2Q70_00034105 [Brassica cretica]